MAQNEKKTRAQESIALPPHTGRTPDGFGYLSMTFTYESIDRENIKSISAAVRVRPGPVMKKRSLVRSELQKCLDEMFDYVEQTETPDALPDLGET